MDQALEPYAYLKDVRARLPNWKNNQIDELVPQRWWPRVT
jgi:hypothetical protein